MQQFRFVCHGWTSKPIAGLADIVEVRKHRRADSKVTVHESSPNPRLLVSTLKVGTCDRKRYSKVSALTKHISKSINDGSRPDKYGCCILMRFTV